jgi:hypothetical protein
MLKSSKGKILRVKQGYNPNSSSIGSIVFAVPTMLLISSAIFGTATIIIFSKFIRKTDVSKDEAVSKEQIE